MRVLLSLTFVLACVAVVTGQHAKAPAGEAAGPDRAVSVLIPMGDSGVTGVVYFTKEGKSVHVSGTVTGLKPGEHGFHVHQFGDVTSTDGMSAGGHFNPENKMHGKPGDKERHVGDLGNITAGADGVAKIDIKDSMLELEGPHSILGRGLVVHANPDKFTQPVGDAGGRVAVGAIGIASPPKK
ncbi:MAG TPA: superoxide dismutase family protein [Pirellulales bacterium]|nr:superoxide dismutase family protein [Pirellulales bacterium]